MSIFAPPRTTGWLGGGTTLGRTGAATTADAGNGPLYN